MVCGPPHSGWWPGVSMKGVSVDCPGRKVLVGPTVGRGVEVVAVSVVDSGAEVYVGKTNCGPSGCCQACLNLYPTAAHKMIAARMRTPRVVRSKRDMG